VSLKSLSGPNPAGGRQRVIVLTSDASLLASLRRDSRVQVIAHVEDPALAANLAAVAGADAIVADEALAAELGEAALARPLWVLRPAVSWAPAGPRDGLSEPSAGEPLRPPEAWTSRIRPAKPETASTGGGPSGALPERPRWGPELRELRLEPRIEAAPTARAEVLMRQTIAVVSPKGGVGKTFVSVNLAAALASQTGFRVILVDLDLRSGDAAVHLDLIGRPTLTELVPYLGSLRAAELGRAVVTHQGSRLDVLLAPAKAEAAEMLGPENIRVLLRLLKQLYDFVVIDTPPDPSGPVVAECLDEATAVVLVSSLDAAALRQCRLFLEGFEGFGSRRPESFRRELYLVLNQVRDGAPLSAPRAAGFLQEGLDGADRRNESRTIFVPEDRNALERAVFDGRPLVLSDPGHPVSRAVFGLAQAFCPVFTGLIGEARPRRGGLGRLVEVLKRW